MLDHLVHFVEGLGHWAYLVVFLAVTLESAAFLGFVVPGETLVLLGGFLAAQGILDPFRLAALVCFGAILGDSIGYEVGRHFGREWLLAHGRWVGLTEARLRRVDDFFHAHGGKTVLIGRFSAFLRALTPFIAGASRMKYLRFLLYNALGGIIWSIIFVALGYLFGASWHLVEHWAGRAGAVLGGGLVLVILLVLLWRWMIHHEQGIRQRWARFLERPRVVSLRRRFAPLIEFLQARLTPGGYLGLHVTVGALVLIAAAWVFGGIAQDVVSGDPLTIIDRRVEIWLNHRTTPALTSAMFAISTLGSMAFVGGVAIVVALVLAWQRNWYKLLALLLSVPLGAMLNVLLKHIFHRHRPELERPLVHLTTYSFPSGHADASTLIYGLLAIFLVQYLQSWRWRTLVVLAAILLVLAIGFSRLYLGAHYLSDVLAAYAEGVAWLAICLTAVATLRHGDKRDNARRRT